MALTDSLDELITSGAITPQLAMKVLQQVREIRGVQDLPVTNDGTPTTHHQPPARAVRQVACGHHGEAG